MDVKTPITQGQKQIGMSIVETTRSVFLSSNPP